MIFSGNYYKSITSVKVDGDVIKLEKDDYIIYSKGMDLVYFNNKVIGKKLEVFKNIKFGDTFTEVCEEKLELEDNMAYVYISNYGYEENYNYYKYDYSGYKRGELSIVYGYELVDNTVIDLDYYELEDIIDYDTDLENDVILYAVSFKFDENDDVQKVDDIRIYYLGKDDIDEK